MDVALPLDVNIKDKETLSKNQDLKLELQKMWNVKAKVVPVVIGALGATSTEIEKHMKNIPGNHDVIKTITQGSPAREHTILQRVLDLPGT